MGKGMPDWQEVDDKQLVQCARQGDVQAYGEIYNRYAGKIYRFLLAHLDNEHDAEDLTEEIFFRVWKALSTYEEKGAILRIADSTSAEWTD